MSGNFGWGGRDRDDDFDSKDNSFMDHNFSKARKPYQGATPDYSRANSLANQAGNPASVGMSRKSNKSKSSLNIDLSPRRAQKTTKKNVIIANIDMTGSMGSWRQEILKRAALLFKEAQGYLGDSLEILFATFGDVGCGDPIEVAPLGSGPELDDYLLALGKLDASGGGNAVESAEMLALYSNNLLDTSEAQQVFAFFITDEGFYDELSPDTANAILGLRLPPELKKSKALFQNLKRKMNLFTIFASTDCYESHINQRNVIKWKDAVGQENVVPLDDARRIVDIILGVIAKITGQYDGFSKDLFKRQSPTQHGSENIATVHQSLSLVRGAPTRPLPGAGTKSLIEDADEK